MSDLGNWTGRGAMQEWTALRYFQSVKPIQQHATRSMNCGGLITKSRLGVHVSLWMPMVPPTQQGRQTRDLLCGYLRF